MSGFLQQGHNGPQTSDLCPTLFVRTNTCTLHLKREVLCLQNIVRESKPTGPKLQ